MIDVCIFTISLKLANATPIYKKTLGIQKKITGL